jgi:hypothetical protein
MKRRDADPQNQVLIATYDTFQLRVQAVRAAQGSGVLALQQVRESQA